MGNQSFVGRPKRHSPKQNDVFREAEDVLKTPQPDTSALQSSEGQIKSGTSAGASQTDVPSLTGGFEWGDERRAFPRVLQDVVGHGPNQGCDATSILVTNPATAASLSPPSPGSLVGRNALTFRYDGSELAEGLFNLPDDGAEHEFHEDTMGDAATTLADLDVLYNTLVDESVPEGDMHSSCLSRRTSQQSIGSGNEHGRNTVPPPRNEGRGKTQTSSFSQPTSHELYACPNARRDAEGSEQLRIDVLATMPPPPTPMGRLLSDQTGGQFGTTSSGWPTATRSNSPRSWSFLGAQLAHQVFKFLEDTSCVPAIDRVTCTPVFSVFQKELLSLAVLGSIPRQAVLFGGGC